jgi:hypothetical protein
MVNSWVWTACEAGGRYLKELCDITGFYPFTKIHTSFDIKMLGVYYFPKSGEFWKDK